MAPSLINVKVTGDNREIDHLFDLRDAFAGTEIADEVDKALVPLRRDIRLRARRQPGSPVYPIEWTPSSHPEDAGKKPNTSFGYYSRQKSAFFASNAFGKGIPFHRSGDMAGAWDVRTRRRAHDVVLELTNDSPEFPFVEGEWQQKFNANTGWDQSDWIFDDITMMVDARVPDVIDVIIRHFLDGA